MGGWVGGWSELELRLSSGQLELGLGLSLAKIDIFKIYTKGLWENVKDGISRPIGSQEIQKTKVETDLLDTLCMYACVFTAFFQKYQFSS